MDEIGLGIAARRGGLFDRFIRWTEAEWTLVVEKVNEAMALRDAAWRKEPLTSCRFEPESSPWLSPLNVTGPVVFKIARRSYFGIERENASLIFPTSGKNWEIYEVVFADGRVPRVSDRETLASQPLDHAARR